MVAAGYYSFLSRDTAFAICFNSTSSGGDTKNRTDFCRKICATWLPMRMISPVSTLLRHALPIALSEYL